MAAPPTATKPVPSSPRGGRSASGRNIAFVSSQFNLPPQCDQRCTTGDHPPDIATTSHFISSIGVPSPACKQIETPITPFEPLTFEMAIPVSTRIPNSRALFGSSPVATVRASRIIATFKPTSNCLIAVLYPSSLFVASTMISPHEVPKSTI